MSSSSSAFPEPVYEIIPEPEEEIYLTVGDFVATAGDGISFTVGKECTVVTKNPAGWWYVEMDGKEGWVPSSYLERKPASPSPLSVKSHPVIPPAFSIPNKKALLKKKEPPKEPRREPWKEPAKREEAKKEPPRPPREPKEPQQKKEPQQRKEPQHSKEPQPRKDPQPRKEVSPLTARRLSLSSKGPHSEERRSLRRSTSTDSGLYEEVGIRKDSYLHSPPPTRSNAPPKPSRPKNAPTQPNTIASSKSPRGDRRQKLKATISGPKPFEPSPNTRRRSEQTTPPSRTLKPISGSRSPAARPQIKRENSDELSQSWAGTKKGSNSIDGGRHTNKSSNSDTKLGALQEMNRRGTGNLSSPRPAPHARHGSADSSTASAYKLELAKKLSGKSGPPSATAQPPKRPSPPNRPKAPPGARNAPPPGSRAPPSRPQPPPGKRPPPPRPNISPATMAKKTVYVTIGGYSGGDAGSSLRFSDGMEVEVVEKNNDGWWFVNIGNKEGWAPSTYIEERERPITSSFSGRPYPSRAKALAPSSSATLPVNKKPEPEDTDSTPKPKPRPRPRKSTAAFYRANESYDVPAYEDSGMTLVKGRVYELKEKSENGWWLMVDGDTEGWAPASHFKPA